MKQVIHNISLTFDFVRELIKNPELLKELPDEFELEFIEKDIPAKAVEDLKNKQLVKVKNTFELIPSQKKN